MTTIPPYHEFLSELKELKQITYGSAEFNDKLTALVDAIHSDHKCGEVEYSHTSQVLQRAETERVLMDLLRPYEIIHSAEDPNIYARYEIVVCIDIEQACKELEIKKEDIKLLWFQGSDICLEMATGEQRVLVQGNPIMSEIKAMAERDVLEEWWVDQAYYTSVDQLDNHDMFKEYPFRRHLPDSPPTPPADIDKPVALARHKKPTEV